MTKSGVATTGARWRSARWSASFAQSKAWLASALTHICVLTLLMKHRRAPWTSRAVAVFTVSYLLSPIQLIPTFLPVIGQLDDLFVLFVGMKMIRRFTPSEILTECEQRAASSVFRKRSSTHRQERAETGNVALV